MLKVELEKVKPNVWNCNFLTDEERQRLKRQMSISGPERTPPIMIRVIDDAYEIVDGEQRWSLAGELGWKYVCAVQVEAEELEAKALCLSYNCLKGKINWFKLSSIMDEELRGVCKEILDDEEIEEVLSLRNVEADARRLLEMALLKGSQLTLEHLNLISTLPTEIQRQVAERAIKYQVGVGELKALMERLVTPFDGRQTDTPSTFPPQTKPAKLEEARKTEKVEDVGDEEHQVSIQGKPEEKIERTEEAEALFTCECGLAYLADWEARKILRVKERGRITMRMEEETFPITLNAKCPKCGLQGIVDVESGEVRWQLHA